MRGFIFGRNFSNRAVCKTSNKMEICNFFQICSSFSHLPAHSGAKIWTSDEISRIKIHPKWSRAGFRVFPTIGGRYQMGMNLDSHIGECYEAELLSLQFNAAPSRMFWMNTHHHISSVPSFHRKVGIFQSDSYCRPPLCCGWDEARICDMSHNQLHMAI